MVDEHILIIEDEESIRETLAFMLEREGFRVTAVADGMQGVEAFVPGDMSLVLLDVMLPQLTGTEVCKKIRAESDVPIIMVSAKGDEIDRVVGLELGADDYVTKPFSSRELLARIKAVLRRGPAKTISGDGVLAAGPIRLDADRHVVEVRGEPIKVALKEFELLEMLMRHNGRVMTRSQLIDRIWGADYVGDTKTLDVHIKRLRSKIERDTAHPELITTVRGLGYKFEA